MPGRGVLRIAIVLLLAACGPPVGVKLLAVQDVHRELAGNVLTGGTPSTASRIELQKRGVAEPYGRDAAGVLRALHATLLGDPTDADLLFALAELSFDHAMHGGGRAYYLAAVVYAYDYLFGVGAGERLDVFDPRGRLCANLYNVGLARAFASEERGRVVLEAGLRKLPFGTLDVAFDPDTLVWGDRRLVAFTSASELGVRGLRNRYRTWGLGAPLNATTAPLDPAGAISDFVVPRVRVPVTLVLLPRPDGGGLASGHLAGRLAVHAVTERRALDIDGRRVPLEYEPTSALAEMLGGSEAWKLELRGFLSGDLVARALPDRLGGLEPLRPDKVPVVLVHGTASSAARWAEMANDLTNDPEIRRRFQFWVFSYDTGNPVVYSAMQLREALQKVLRAFDPEERSACLRRMVVVGHSQGGLLARLMVVEGGDRFWRNASDRPFEETAMSSRTRELLRRALFVSPLPFVSRVIFIATPHRGSYRAGGFVRNVLQRLVSFPSDVTRVGSDLLTGDEAGHLARQLGRMPTSVDNMAPGSPFVQTLSSLPIARGVSAHSIIPVLGDGPLEQGKDGVVAYTSAHLDGVESELVVRPSGHSTQGNPHTIEEVRRILAEHAAQVFDGGDCRAPAAGAP